MSSLKKQEIFNSLIGDNSGETGWMKDQGCDNYWDLYTNTETSRYVYRIIAYKWKTPTIWFYFGRKIFPLPSNSADYRFLKSWASKLNINILLPNSDEQFYFLPANQYVGKKFE